MNISHLIKEIRQLLGSKLFFKYLMMMAFANVGLNVISDDLNIAMNAFGYKQTDGSWALCYFYILGLCGAVVYDRWLLPLKQEKRFLILYTYVG